MRFEQTLIPGILLKRYKRFLADIQIKSGEIVTAHCTNSGSMKSCLEANAPVYISPAKNPSRKTKFTWEMIYINDNWIGINTMIPNVIAYESIVQEKIKKISGYRKVVREVKFGDSRFDLFAEKENEKCFIEVKNVTLKEGRFARFPDAITTRGKKHLETLIEVRKNGIRAVMLYIIQRSDVEIFGPAWNIDPDYSQSLLKASQNGVEIITLRVKVSPTKIIIDKELPINLAENS